MKSDEKEKVFELKIKEREVIVIDKENKLAEEDKKLLGRKAYLIDKESNIDKKIKKKRL